LTIVAHGKKIAEALFLVGQQQVGGPETREEIPPVVRSGA